MRGRTSMAGVSEGGVYELLPENRYFVKIIECADGYSKAQDPMITVTYEIIEGEYSGRKLWDRIIIGDSPSGVKIKGRSKHFLHCIGEEYEGEFEWDSTRWLFKKVWIDVIKDPAKDGYKAKNSISNYILDDKGWPADEADDKDEPDL